MYLAHYGLSEPPFSITPDPRFVFLSERHRDALAHLLFGIGQGGGGGFVQLTGEVGTGKTTLSRLLLEQLPADTRVALVLNPRVSAIELLETVCEELRLDIEGRRGSAKALVDVLNAFLLDAYAQGLRVVLIVDEAQNLSVDALEQVRLLTNLETDTQKLLQVVLLGQPELRDMLARDDLRQLAQRITARFHLTPLDAAETAEYLRHRFRVAGGQRFPFDAGALRRLHARSGGVPRLLNVVAERTLLAGYARDAQVLDAGLVDLAADEALPAPDRARGTKGWAMAGGIALAALVALMAATWWRRPDPARPLGTTPTTSIAPTAPPMAMHRPAVVAIDDEATLAGRLARAGTSPVPAWRRLLSTWSLPAASVTLDPAGRCTAIAPGVHCVAGRGRLDKLLALDRPVVLPMRAGTTSAFALLLGADARRARVVVGADTFDVDRMALQSAWRGDYAAAWRGPSHLAVAPVRGQRGPAVDWLRARLALPASADAGYDAATVEAVRRFQLARGLPADGVAGPETLMALADAQAGPRLLRTLD